MEKTDATESWKIGMADALAFITIKSPKNRTISPITLYKN